MTVSITQQIEEVEHELRMRERVYPGLVARKKLTQGSADYHMDRMRAVMNTLVWLQANEVKIKARVDA